MAAISDREALAYLLEQVLQADADAPVTLALEPAGVRTASDLMSLEVSQDMPLKYDHPAEGSENARKTYHYSWQKCAKSKDSRITFAII